jgi:hypothetical protein
MPTPNRAHASTPRPTAVCLHGHAVPAPLPSSRVVSTGLLAGAARHVGSLLVGLVMAWWQHD